MQSHTIRKNVFRERMFSSPKRIWRTGPAPRRASEEAKHHPEFVRATGKQLCLRTMNPSHFVKPGYGCMKTWSDEQTNILRGVLVYHISKYSVKKLFLALCRRPAGQPNQASFDSVHFGGTATSVGRWGSAPQPSPTFLPARKRKSAVRRFDPPASLRLANSLAERSSCSRLSVVHLAFALRSSHHPVSRRRDRRDA